MITDENHHLGESVAFLESPVNFWVRAKLAEVENHVLDMHTFEFYDSLLIEPIHGVAEDNVLSIF